MDRIIEAAVNSLPILGFDEFEVDSGAGEVDVVVVVVDEDEGFFLFLT